MGAGVLTAGFHRVEGELWCDGLSLDSIAAAVGTPAYVYSARSIREQFQKLTDAIGVPHRLHFSVKANSSLAVLDLLRLMGAGLDIVSGGELFRALRAGFRGQDVVFSGVGKTETELREAVEAGVLLVNVESESELRTLASVAASMETETRIALRVNPEVTVDTPHPYTRTGERGMKFGIPHDEVVDVARVAASLRGVKLVGLDMHVGSQISQFAPYEAGIQRLLALRNEIESAGLAKIEYLDIGGGLAVTYESEYLDVGDFGARVSALMQGSGVTVLLEPGRYLVGNAGVLLTRVLYRKRSGGKEFVVTDAGMNDLLRPSHYNAFHRIEAVGPQTDRMVASVVGPVCETGDFFALDREIEEVEPGELVAVESAGAYGFVMASNYNSRPRPPEVLVDGDRYALIRERETYEDLVRGESTRPDWRQGAG